MNPSRRTAADYDRVLEAVRQHAGLGTGPGLRPSAEAGIRRAATRLGLTRDALADRLPRDAAALGQVLEEITVGETYFLREPAQFELIRDRVAPALRERGGPARAWSAGCATGEEAWSLALTLLDAGVGEARVLGTDLCPHRLALARRGRYGAWSLRGVPPAVVRRWFRSSGTRHEIARELRPAVGFRPLNLVADDYPSAATGVLEMDLILCRNVLIYLEPAAVARVAGRLLAALAPEGWLLLGASDPPLAELVPCTVEVTPAGVAYRRPRGRALPRPREAPAPAPPAARAVPAPPVGAAPPAAPPQRPTPAAASGPPTLAAVLAEVRTLADHGRLREAGAACEEALRRFRDSAELTYLHAALLAQGGRHADAARAARRALYLDRGLAVAHLALGLALARTGDAAGARRALGSAERLLAAADPAAPVPASGGEPAARLLTMARAQLRRLGGAAA